MIVSRKIGRLFLILSALVFEIQIVTTQAQVPSTREPP